MRKMCLLLLLVLLCSCSEKVERDWETEALLARTSLMGKGVIVSGQEIDEETLRINLLLLGDETYLEGKAEHTELFLWVIETNTEDVFGGAIPSDEKLIKLMILVWTDEYLKEK